MTIIIFISMFWIDEKARISSKIILEVKKCCLQILIYNYYQSYVDNLLEITAEKYMLVCTKDVFRRLISSFTSHKRKLMFINKRTLQ